MFETNNGTSLYSRLVSAFMLSLPTSFAFESIFPGRQPTYDPDRVLPDRVDITNYQEMWINLYTLYRNMSGVVDKEAFLRTHDIEIADALLQEIEVIDSIMSNEGQGMCKAKFYVCTYDDLYLGKVSKYVKARKDNTDYQKLMKQKFVNSMATLAKQYKYTEYNTVIEGNPNAKALMLTHVPYDLVHYQNFSQLDLIESHTGVLKPKHMWYTKYYPVGEEDLKALPFHKKLLLIFGDKVLISPTDIRLRRQVLQVAKMRHWTQATSVSKIMYDLEVDIKEPLVLEAIRSF